VDSRVTSKTVTFENVTYQINKIDARTGCWLFSFMGSRSSGDVLSALGKCSRSEFLEIQDIALRAVYTLDVQDGNTFPIAVIAQTGAFVNPELAKDTETVFKLTCESLLFNLSPFLVAAGSNSQLSTTPAGNQ
jgi:hypothetical protein